MFADVASLAFKFANSLRKLFAEGAFNASFLPIFSNVLKERGHEEARKLAAQIFTWITLSVSLLLILLLIFFRKIMGGFAAGIDQSSEKFEHLIAIGKICSPYVAASVLAALFGGILNTLNRFAMPAAAQLILNIFVIISLYSGPLFFPSTAYTMAVAVFLSGVVQVAVLWIDVKINGFSIRFDFSKMKDEVKTFGRKLFSGVIGAGVLQLNILIDFVVLSFLPTGAVSYFYYVDHVHQFPIGILGIAFSTALLPPITSAINGRDFSTAQVQMNVGLLYAVLLTLPATIILMTLSEPVIGAIYGRGNFSPEHVEAAAPALVAFSQGLPVYMVTKVFSTVFFANKDTKTPLRGGILAIFVNLFFIGLLVPCLKHTGIALATTLSSWCNGIYLAENLKEKCGIRVDSATKRIFGKQLLASLAMLLAILVMNMYAAPCYSQGGITRQVALISVVISGTIIYMAVGKITGASSFLNGKRGMNGKNE
jgi:putative peptidoglycan lipid II flippase